jgi:ribose transport system ATP-binding protein
MPASVLKLQTIDLRKVYPGTEALRGVSIGFAGGKVHALIGKNGAGKSTLVKILSGAVEPTSGQLLVDGQAVRLQGPKDAFHKGIATVYQEMSLVPELTVAENILLGRLPRRGPGKVLVDWAEVHRRSRAVLDRMNVRLDVEAKVAGLSVAQQQIVEIARAMSFSPAVLMLDEPTSALGYHEVEGLFGLVRQLAGQGVAVVYITHRLNELKEIADTVSVLRDGQLVGTIDAQQADAAKLVEMMFGQTVPKSRPADLKVAPEPVLEVQNLSKQGELDDVSFTLHRGEVLGLAGMLGSGRTELLMSIFGAEPADSGRIVVGGREIARPSPRRMKKAGIALAPENRKEHGLVLLLNTSDNMSLAGLDRLSTGGVMRKDRQRRMVRDFVERLQIAVADVGQSVASLSGGNQQKVVIGNWLNTTPQILLLDEPTRGIDVQAKQQVFQIIWDLSRSGISSLVVSSELEELLEVCHRILIMQKGRIVGEVRPEGVSLERLFAQCIEA